MVSAPHDNPGAAREALRRQLLATREAFAASAPHALANVALSRHLIGLLSELEPDSLGLYWPVRSEFNAVVPLLADPGCAKLPISLPFAQRTPPRMAYRAWDGTAPSTVDECGIPTANGTPVVPDVVLVPCVGFTAGGFRLGYGGGYFDRWLAAHPHVTSIGIAWACGRIADAAGFAPEPHDQALTLVLTEDGVA